MHAVRNPMDVTTSVIRRHVAAYRVFLFGSPAAGSAGERSDIDIGIDGPAQVARASLVAIHDELEEAPTLYTIDNVDFARIPQRFPQVGNGGSWCDPKSQSLRVD